MKCQSVKLCKEIHLKESIHLRKARLLLLVAISSNKDTLYFTLPTIYYSVKCQYSFFAHIMSYDQLLRVSGLGGRS